MDEDRVKCSLCGSSYNKMFLMGKQGNVDICPMCGGELQVEDEHADWITWYYYGITLDNGKSGWLLDKPVDLEKHGDVLFLIKEFKAPPKDSSGEFDKAKEILRTYVPDAFTTTPQPSQTVYCPYCHST